MLRLEKETLRNLWLHGALSDVAYAVLFLIWMFENSWQGRLEKDGPLYIDDGDIALLQSEWDGVNKKGAYKQIKRKAIIDALEKIAGVNEEAIAFQQLQIFGIDELVPKAPEVRRLSLLPREGETA